MNYFNKLNNRFKKKLIKELKPDSFKNDAIKEGILGLSIGTALSVIERNPSGIAQGLALGEGIGMADAVRRHLLLHKKRRK